MKTRGAICIEYIVFCAKRGVVNMNKPGYL